MESVIVAVDAGGTKTKLALITEAKEIVYEIKTGSGSPAVTKKALDNIYEGLKTICNYAKAKYEIKAIVIGMSALYIVENKEEYIQKISNDFQTKVFLESDALLALYSIIQDVHKSGVLVLAGTGTAVLATDGKDTFMTSGWGHLLTERGSAFASVRDFICLMIREYEERNYISNLGHKFMEHMGYNDIHLFKMLIYNHSKDDVAEYSRFFDSEADKGDLEAQNWLLKNGEFLGIDVQGAMLHMKFPNEVIIGFRGGFAGNVKWIQQGVLEYLEKQNIKTKVVDGDKDPIFGAYYIAKRRKVIC